MHIALYKRIALTFIGLSVILAGLSLYVVFSHATVTVFTKPEPVETDVVVDVARKPSPGEIEGEIVSLVSTITRTFPTATAAKVDVPATGKVRIKSSLGRPQTLIATTRLLTPDNILFRLNDTVTVPANGSVEAAVHADVPGASGNVGAATFTIPGLNADLRQRFETSTVEPIENGVRDMKVVTKKDVDAATETVKEKLSAEMQAQLKQKAGERWSGDGVGSIFQVTLDSTKVNAAPGDEVGEYTLTAEVRATAVFYDKTQFIRQIEAQLGALVPVGKRISDVSYDDQTIAIDKADGETGRGNLRVTGMASSLLSPEAADIAPAKLVGLNTDAAKAYLGQVEGVSTISIEIRPFWSSKLPTDPSRITIEVR